jgi:hypothetical protein
LNGMMSVVSTSDSGSLGFAEAPRGDRDELWLANRNVLLVVT